jgi:hypothetical protein
MATNDDRQACIDAETARQQTQREQRLAKALRANLRRRKTPASRESDPDDKGGP